MKLFFYINVLAGGGAERVVSNLANQLAAAGETVAIVTSFPTENEYPVSDAVTRYQLDGEKPKTGFVAKNYHRIRALRKLLKREKPDLLIAFMAEPNYRAVLAAKGLKTPVMISVRNDPNKEYAGRFGRFLGKHLLPSADACVFQTEDAKAWFPEKLQKKSRIIFNQVAEVFYETERSDTPRDVVTFGRLTEQKNQEMLIRAFARIAPEVDDNLIIYGNGELREALEKVVDELGMKERVFLPGATRDVANILSAAKLFVLPSDYEGMPNALMEAMAAGVPAISTDCPCGGPRMLLEDGKFGVLTPVGDEDALAEKMKTLLCDPDALCRFGTLAREKAEAFRPETILASWRDYIKEVVDKK